MNASTADTACPIKDILENLKRTLNNGSNKWSDFYSLFYCLNQRHPETLRSILQLLQAKALRGNSTQVFVLLMALLLSSV